MRLALAHPPVPRSVPLALAVALGLIGLIGAIDYATGASLSVAFLYVLPVAWISWILGRRWGIAAAVTSGAFSLVADLAARTASEAAWVPFWNAGVEVAVLMGAALTLPALRQAMEREQRASRKDYLTGLANWRAFAEACEDELARLRRFDRPLTLVYMDCDDFKQVNDELGHTEGDRLLRDVAAALTGTVREVDTVARLGGDEFVVLLPETDAEAAAAAVERIREALSSAMRRRGDTVTVSIGAATFTTAPASIDELVAAADRLMYDAKHGGRDRAVLAVFGEAASQGDARFRDAVPGDRPSTS